MVATLFSFVPCCTSQGSRPNRTAFAPAFGTGRPRRPDNAQDVIEAALAHVVRNWVEVAYARSDLFDRWRILVDH